LARAYFSKSGTCRTESAQEGSLFLILEKVLFGQLSVLREGLRVAVRDIKEVFNNI
jgi:hypothetical protein